MPQCNKDDPKSGAGTSVKLHSQSAISTSSGTGTTVPSTDRTRATHITSPSIKGDADLHKTTTNLASGAATIKPSKSELTSSPVQVVQSISGNAGKRKSSPLKRQPLRTNLVPVQVVSGPVRTNLVSATVGVSGNKFSASSKRREPVNVVSDTGLQCPPGDAKRSSDGNVQGVWQTQVHPLFKRKLSFEGPPIYKPNVQPSQGSTPQFPLSQPYLTSWEKPNAIPLEGARPSQSQQTDTAISPGQKAASSTPRALLTHCEKGAKVTRANSVKVSPGPATYPRSSSEIKVAALKGDEKSRISISQSADKAIEQMPITEKSFSSEARDGRNNATNPKVAATCDTPANKHISKTPENRSTDIATPNKVLPPCKGLDGDEVSGLAQTHLPPATGSSGNHSVDKRLVSSSVSKNLPGAAKNPSPLKQKPDSPSIKKPSSSLEKDTTGQSVNKGKDLVHIFQEALSDLGNALNTFVQKDNARLASVKSRKLDASCKASAMDTTKKTPCKAEVNSPTEISSLGTSHGVPSTQQVLTDCQRDSTSKSGGHVTSSLSTINNLSDSPASLNTKPYLPSGATGTHFLHGVHGASTSNLASSKTAPSDIRKPTTQNCSSSPHVSSSPPGEKSTLTVKAHMHSSKTHSSVASDKKYNPLSKFSVAKSYIIKPTVLESPERYVNENQYQPQRKPRSHHSTGFQADQKEGTSITSSSFYRQKSSPHGRSEKHSNPWRLSAPPWKLLSHSKHFAPWSGSPERDAGSSFNKIPGNDPGRIPAKTRSRHTSSPNMLPNRSGVLERSSSLTPSLEARTLPAKLPHQAVSPSGARSPRQTTSPRHTASPNKKSPSKAISPEKSSAVHSSTSDDRSSSKAARTKFQKSRSFVHQRGGPSFSDLLKIASHNAGKGTLPYDLDPKLSRKRRHSDGQVKRDRTYDDRSSFQPSSFTGRFQKLGSLSEPEQMSKPCTSGDSVSLSSDSASQKEDASSSPESDGAVNIEDHPDKEKASSGDPGESTHKEGIQGLFNELQPQPEDRSGRVPRSPSTSLSVPGSPSRPEKKLLSLAHMKKVRVVLSGKSMKKHLIEGSTSCSSISGDESVQLERGNGKGEDDDSKKESGDVEMGSDGGDSSDEDDSFLMAKPSALIEETTALLDVPMPGTPSKSNISLTLQSSPSSPGPSSRIAQPGARPKVHYTLDRILHLKLDQERKYGDISAIRNELMDGVSTGGVAKLAEKPTEEYDEEIDPAEYAKCVEGYNTKTEKIPEIPPGEEIFHKENVCQIFTPTQCLQNFQTINRANSVEDLLGGATIEEIEELIRSGFLECYYDGSQAPSSSMQWMFRLMSVHPSCFESQILYETQWGQLNKAPLWLGELDFPWTPTMRDVITVLLNYGGDIAGLISVSDCDVSFTLDNLRELDAAAQNAARSGDVYCQQPEFFNTLLENQLGLVLQVITQAIITHLAMKNCSGYRTEELQCLLIIMLRISLDKRIVGHPVIVDISNAVAAIIEGFEDVVWHQQVERLCVLFPLITSHHHNMVYLLQNCIPLHLERGRYLYRMLGYAGLQKLVFPEKGWRDMTGWEVPEIKVSSLIPILHCCKPSKDTDYYQLNSIILLLDFSIGNEKLKSNEKRDLEKIIRKLREMVGDIRESALSLSRSQVKSLIVRTAAKLSFMTQSMVTDKRGLEKIICKLREMVGDIRESALSLSKSQVKSLIVRTAAKLSFMTQSMVTDKEGIFSFLRSDMNDSMDMEVGGNTEHHISSQTDPVSDGEDSPAEMEVEDEEGIYPLGEAGVFESEQKPTPSRGSGENDQNVENKTSRDGVDERTAQKEGEHSKDKSKEMDGDVPAIVPDGILTGSDRVAQDGENPSGDTDKGISVEGTVPKEGPQGVLKSPDWIAQNGENPLKDTDKERSVEGEVPKESPKIVIQKDSRDINEEEASSDLMKEDLQGVHKDPEIQKEETSKDIEEVKVGGSDLTKEAVPGVVKDSKMVVIQNQQPCKDTNKLEDEGVNFLGVLRDHEGVTQKREEVTKERVRETNVGSEVPKEGPQKASDKVPERSDQKGSDSAKEKEEEMDVESGLGNVCAVGDTDRTVKGIVQKDECLPGVKDGSAVVNGQEGIQETKDLQKGDECQKLGQCPKADPLEKMEGVMLAGKSTDSKQEAPNWERSLGVTVERMEESEGELRTISSVTKEQQAEGATEVISNAASKGQKQELKETKNVGSGGKAKNNKLGETMTSSEEISIIGLVGKSKRAMEIVSSKEVKVIQDKNAGMDGTKIGVTSVGDKLDQSESEQRRLNDEVVTTRLGEGKGPSSEISTAKVGQEKIKMRAETSSVARKVIPSENTCIVETPGEKLEGQSRIPTGNHLGTATKRAGEGQQRSKVTLLPSLEKTKGTLPKGGHVGNLRILSGLVKNQRELATGKIIAAKTSSVIGDIAQRIKVEKTNKLGDTSTGGTREVVDVRGHSPNIGGKGGSGDGMRGPSKLVAGQISGNKAGPIVVKSEVIDLTESFNESVECIELPESDEEDIICLDD